MGVVDELTDPDLQVLLTEMNKQSFKEKLLTKGGTPLVDILMGRDKVVLNRVLQPVINILPDGTIVPPGVGVTPTGVESRPHIMDAIMGDAIRTLPMYGLNQNVTLGSITYYNLMTSPDNTVGPTAGPVVASDEWKWGHVTRIANGADIELVPTVAAKKIQIVVTKVTVTPVTAADTFQVGAVTLQDSDNVNLSGTYVYNVPFFFGLLILMAQSGSLSFPWMGAVAYSATANRAIEMDVAGLGGNDIVDIYFAWREFA